MAKESAHIIVQMEHTTFVRARFFTGLTIQQANALLINAAVDKLIEQEGYPKAIEHEIIYAQSYVSWPMNVVYLCIIHQE